MLSRRRRKRTPATPPGGLTPLDAAVTPTAYGAVVTLAGELDIATVPRVREAIAAPTVAAASAVLVDLTGVTFMDSTGLAVLLGLERDLSARRGRLAVVCPEGPARLLLDVTGVAERLELHPTRAAAEDALSSPRAAP